MQHRAVGTSTEVQHAPSRAALMDHHFRWQGRCPRWFGGTPYVWPPSTWSSPGGHPSRLVPCPCALQVEWGHAV